jgi:hypothetical protein
VENQDELLFGVLIKFSKPSDFDFLAISRILSPRR